VAASKDAKPRQRQQLPFKIEADEVISCIPAQSLAKLLPESLESTKENLSSIDCSSVASVNMGWIPSRGDILQGKRGFGYLVPTSQWETGGPEEASDSTSPSDVIPGVLGMTWDSCVFPTQGIPSKWKTPVDPPNAEYVPEKHGTRVTAMIGGSHFPDIEEMSRDEIKLLARLATREHMNIETEPDVLEASVAKHAIPQYKLGHQRRLAAIREEINLKLPRLHLAGNSYDGVGVADCVNSAFGALRKLLNK
jgi:oxygen-dependent protoporphyrinogen oxidase